MNQLDLNLASAILVGILAVSAFSLDIVSSPKQTRWMSLPPIIRWEIRITAAVLMIRSVNLFGMVGEDAPKVGQANWFTLTSSFCLAVTVVSLVFYALNSNLPARGWERMMYVFRTMRSDPEWIPVLMSKKELIEAHHAAGQPAVDGTDPMGVVREASRAGRMAARRPH